VTAGPGGRPPIRLVMHSVVALPTKASCTRSAANARTRAPYVGSRSHGRAPDQPHTSTRPRVGRERLELRPGLRDERVAVHRHPGAAARPVGGTVPG
jgi:hypothetical protein